MKIFPLPYIPLFILCNITNHNSAQTNFLSINFNCSLFLLLSYQYFFLCREFYVSHSWYENDLLSLLVVDYITIFLKNGIETEPLVIIKYCTLLKQTIIRLKIWIIQKIKEFSSFLLDVFKFPGIWMAIFFYKE